MADKKSSPKRYRNFGTIVYPESAPADWQNVLSNFHIPAFVSPLHDKDTTDTGALKKAHYHVMIMYDNVKTLEQANELIKAIGGVGCEVIGAISGYARYLCHLDELDKVKYSVDDVRSFSGADYYYITTLPRDRYKSLNDMFEYLEKNPFDSFSSFVTYCRINNFEWFRLLCDNSTYIVDKFIKSATWDASNVKSKKSSKVPGKASD